jgi:cell division protease FtsH
MTWTMEKTPKPEGGPAGPEPVPATEPAGRPRRKRLQLWDRAKFLLLLAALFGFVVSADLSSNPILGWTDALRRQASSAAWILVLAGAEVIRQLHMFIGEHSAGYYAFWNEKVFGRFERRLAKFDDWNRFRMARTAKWLLAIVVLAFVYARIEHDTVFHAAVNVPGKIWHAAPFFVQIMLLMLLTIGQFAALFWFLSKGGVDVYFPDDIKTRFSDVWGQDHVLERIKENVFYLERPEEIEERGGYVPGGILLWGPPGTGKTLMAEAVAGETGKPFVFVDPGAFTAMFFGVGVMKVKSLFRRLRKLALRYGGVIVFFDEADTLGNRGGAVGGNAAAPHPFASLGGDGLDDPAGLGPACNGLAYASTGTRQVLGTPKFVPTGGMGGQSSFDGTLQALLTEMSGLKKPRGFLNRVVRRALGMRPKPPPKYRILVMMATNMPQSLDPALLRPGRIDRLYKVGYPTKGGRIRTYEGYLAKVRNELTPEQIDKLAVISQQATGASIKDVVNEALVLAIRDGREVVSWPDVLRAKSLKEHGLPDGHTYPTRERHSLALHEACHAVAMYRLMKDKVIEIATIERRGDIGGFVAPVPLEDRFVQWRTEIENDVMTFLASLVGERMFFEGDNTQGVGGDMQAATQIIMRSMASHAMGETLISRTVTLVPGATPIQDGSDLDGPFGAAVETKLRELYARTERLLAANRREVLAVTHALERYHTISGEDVEAIIEGMPGPTVDGRRYVEPEFLALAEEYHGDTVRSLHLPIDELPLSAVPGWGRAAADPGVPAES